MDTISEYIAVALASTIKFVGGPIAGVALGLSWTETAVSSAIGMMITVAFITFGSSVLGNLSSRFYKNKPKRIFTKTTRLAVKVKKKLGLWGVAFLTPFLFTPILGTFIALSFRYSKWEIIQKMLVCALVAGFLQTLAFHYVKEIF